MPIVTQATWEKEGLNTNIGGIHVDQAQNIISNFYSVPPTEYKGAHTDRMKVALAFWGLTRSLKYTIHSIRTNILEVLRRHNIEYTIFLHTFTFSGLYTNLRANESNLLLDFEEYKLLCPDHIQIEDQEEVKRTIGVRKYRRHADPWETGYATMDNFLCAMYSKLQLGNMLQQSKQEFDYVMFLRPDVRYLVPFQLDFFDKVNKTTICIPDFHLFTFRFNDRFCLTNYANAIKYCELFHDMLPYSKLHPLHSETFQHATLTKRYGLRIQTVPFYFNRVRADGNEQVDCPKKET